jgi:hypothetical protein
LTLEKPEVVTFVNFGPLWHYHLIIF